MTTVTTRKLRVAFITGEDPLYVNSFFREFFRLVGKEPVEVCAVVILRPFNAPSLRKVAGKMLEFYGLRDFIRQGLRYALRRLFAPNLTQMAKDAGAKVWHETNINRGAFRDKLTELGIDAALSVAAPQIFKSKLLALPPLGCWNIHGGRLPRYRGMMPAFWTMFNGEREGAMTVHRMNEALDDGEILLQELYPIKAGESLDQLTRRSKILGAQVMIKALRMLQSGDYQLSENDRAQATSFTFPTPAEVAEFRRRGFRLL